MSPSMSGFVRDAVAAGCVARRTAKAVYGVEIGETPYPPADSGSPSAWSDAPFT